MKNIEKYFCLFIGFLLVCLFISVLLFKKKEERENFDCDAYCKASAILPIGMFAPSCNCQ